MYEMLERTSPLFYTVRAVNNYEHFQLWKFCSVICSSCEGHRLREGSVNVLISSCSFQLLTKDPHEWLGAYGRLDRVRKHPFFRGVDWCALQEKRVKPPQKPEIVKVSRPSKIMPNSSWLWKLLKISEFRMPTPQDIRKKGSKILKLPRFAIVLH